MSKRKSRKFFPVIGVILLLVAGFYGLLSYLANEKIPKLLGDRVEVENLDIQLFGLTAHFYQPSVKVNGTKKSPDLDIGAQAREITIKGFSIFQLLFSKNLHVDKFIVDSLVLNIDLPKNRVLQTERREINLFVTDVFTRIEVDQFELKGSHFYVRKKEVENNLLEVRGFNLSAEKVSVDTANLGDFFPLQFEKSLTSLDTFFYRANEDYTLQGRSLRITDSTMMLGSFQLRPVSSWAVFVDRHPYEKAMFNVSLDSLTLLGLTWSKDKKEPFHISSTNASLHGLELLVFKDKRSPMEPPAVKPLLAGILKATPAILCLDTLRLKDGYISYEQRPVVYPLAGKVFFDSFYMTGYNITNDPACIRESPITILDVNSKFMKGGDLQVQIKMDMSSENDEFSVQGKLGEMPLTYVNQVLAPLTGIKATGEVKRLVFEFDGDNYDAEGSLDFEYTDLKVAVMDDKSKKVLKSLFGNLLLPNENLKSNDGFNEGEIYFIRYQNKGFFNYLWNSLRVGLMDVVHPFYQNEDKERSVNSPPKYKKDDQDS